MSDPESLRLELPGLTLAALAWGPAEGVPTLCVHGWLDNAASFGPLAERLEGLRIVALDLPGHGHSDHRPEGSRYHFIDWVADVAAAADALGWDRFQLVGHSMGAGIASLVAGTLAERVSRLVLIEGLGPLSCAPEEAPARLAKSIRGRGKAARKPRRVHANLEEAVERLRGVNPALGLDSARRIVERGTVAVEGGVTWRSDPRLRSFSPMRMTEEHVSAFLRRVTLPTLMIRGREGYPFDPQGMGSRVQCLPDVKVVEIPGGHHLHMDAVELVANEVGPFLASPAPSAVSGGPSPVLRGLGVSLEQLAALKGLRLVVLDVDGVLTPGARVDYGPTGNDRLTFSVRDGMGIKMLQRAGVEVALLSGRDSPATRARAQDLAIPHLCLGVEHKVPKLRSLASALGVSLAHVAYMGDDINDLPPLRAVGYPTAPADAHPEVRKVARWVAGAKGGQGAVRELAEHVIKFQGKWEQALAYYGIE
jgi:YrbI family 3-deoxy-D-manno-octulosonate 8-phosphate phosphatase